MAAALSATARSGIQNVHLAWPTLFLPTRNLFGAESGPEGRPCIGPVAEGEGEIDGPAFVDQLGALVNDRGSYFSGDGFPWSCIYPEQTSRD